MVHILLAATQEDAGEIVLYGYKEATLRLDNDIKRMTPGEARQELMRVRRLIRTHRDKEGNARCWHNDVLLYAKALPESQPAGRMDLPVEELLGNCQKYIRGQQCLARGCKKQVPDERGPKARRLMAKVLKRGSPKPKPRRGRWIPEDPFDD